MSIDYFKEAIDYLERIDEYGVAQWTYKKREALMKLNLALNNYEQDVADARRSGIYLATCFHVAALLFVIFLWMYITKH